MSNSCLQFVANMIVSMWMKCAAATFQRFEPLCWVFKIGPSKQLLQAQDSVVLGAKNKITGTMWIKQLLVFKLLPVQRVRRQLWCDVKKKTKKNGRNWEVAHFSELDRGSLKFFWNLSFTSAKWGVYLLFFSFRPKYCKVVQRRGWTYINFTSIERDLLNFKNVILLLLL